MKLNYVFILLKYILYKVLIIIISLMITYFIQKVTRITIESLNH